MTVHGSGRPLQVAESQKTLEVGPVVSADQRLCPRGNDGEQAGAEQGQAAGAQQQASSQCC